jgi:hypothetical protein
MTEVGILTSSFTVVITLQYWPQDPFIPFINATYSIVKNN